MRTARPFHWAWIILSICFANLYINYSVRLGYGVLFPEMIQDLDLSRASGGTIYNAYLFSYILITPFTGYLTDRFGARRVITTCCLILSLGVLAMGQTRSLPGACLSFGIAGIGATGMWAPVITVVQRWFAPHRRGLALGILSTGYGLGFASTGLLFPWAVSRFSWHHAWYILGTAALIMVVLNGLLLRRDPESMGKTPWGETLGNLPVQRPDVRPRQTALTEVFRDRTFWLIGVSYFCIAYCLYGVTTFMVDYAKDQVGLPLEQAALLATIHGVSQVIGVLTILPLSDVLGRKQSITLSNGIIAAAVGGILFSGGSWTALSLLVGIVGVFYGATFPMYGACAGDFFHRDAMGTVIGAWTPFYGLGAILVHWVTGVLRDAAGSYAQPFLVDTLMAAAAVLLMAAAGKRAQHRRG